MFHHPLFQRCAHLIHFKRPDSFHSCLFLSLTGATSSFFLLSPHLFNFNRITGWFGKASSSNILNSFSLEKLLTRNRFTISTNIIRGEVLRQLLMIIKSFGVALLQRAWPESFPLAGCIQPEEKLWKSTRMVRKEEVEIVSSETPTSSFSFFFPTL